MIIHDLERFDVRHRDHHIGITIVLRQFCLDVAEGSAHAESARGHAGWADDELRWFIDVVSRKLGLGLVDFATVLLNALDLTALRGLVIDAQRVGLLAALG